MRSAPAGSLQTSFHVRSRASTFLIDCGVTTLIGMRRLGLQPNDIDTVFVSHLHGDHFGGLPWLLVDALYVSNRKRPLVVTGPKGIEARFVTAAEALYPNITTAKRDFDLQLHRISGAEAARSRRRHGRAVRGEAPVGRAALRAQIRRSTGRCSPLPATPAGSRCCARWRGAPISSSRSAFNTISCSPIHLDYATIDANYQRLGAKRVLLTHMGEAMLANIGKVDPARYLVAR